LIRSRLFFCSDSASIDARTNALSAFHIIEQVNAPSFPVVIPRVSILCFLSREDADPSQVSLQLQIFSGDQKLFDGPVAIDFVQQRATRTILELNGMVVPSPVELRFVLVLEKTVLDSWAITVNQVGLPGLQMTLPPTPAAH